MRQVIQAQTNIDRQTKNLTVKEPKKAQGPEYLCMEEGQTSCRMQRQ